VARTAEDDPLFEVKDGGGDAQSDDGEVPSYNGTGSRDDGIEHDEEEDVAAEVQESSDERRSWEKVLEISAGMMAMSRNFEIANPIKPADPTKHSNYKSGPVAAIQVEVALYPLIYFNRGPLANLGIVARYYRVLGLRSQTEKMVEPVNTTLHTFEGGLRYRWNILDRATSPTLKAGVDFGRQGFKIHDDKGLIPLPDVAYVYLKLALVHLEVPFYASETVTVGGVGTFDYLLIFSAGDIERTDSRGYGRSSTGGIDVGLGLFGSYRGFFGRISGFYRRIFYDFDNTCLNVTECLGAGGALDIYLGGAVSIGYAF
jgi:hypothetical protein